MHIIINKDTGNKWVTLKRSGQFASDDLFLSYLLSHQQICPLVIRNEFNKGLSPGKADERLKIESLDSDPVPALEVVSLDTSQISITKVPCILPAVEPIPKNLFSLDSSEVLSSLKAVSTGEVTIVPLIQPSASQNYFEFGGRKLRNPRVVINRLSSSEIAKFQNRSLPSSSLPSTRNWSSCVKRFKGKDRLELNLKSLEKSAVKRVTPVASNSEVKGQSVSVCDGRQPTSEPEKVKCNGDVQTSFEGDNDFNGSDLGEPCKDAGLCEPLDSDSVVDECVEIPEIQQKWMSRNMFTGASKKEKRTCICEICGRLLKFTCLNNHLETHFRTEASRVPCDKCGKTFVTVSILKRHKMHMHRTTDSLVYLCTKCPKIFSRKGGLATHITRVHERICRYECNICHRKFQLPQFLREHTYIHTGEKPLKCQLCGKDFRQSGSFSKHMILVHKIRRQDNTMIIKQLDGSGGKNNQNMDPSSII